MTPEKRIALVSVHGDPAIEIGKEEAGGQNVYVRRVGEALGRQGWKVDMFTRQTSHEQSKIVQHSPNCRTIRLTAGPEAFVTRDEIFGYLPQFVQAFRQFQSDQGIEYPIIHTNYWLSAWVGMELKKSQSIQQIHTYHSLGVIKYQSVKDIPPIASTRLEIEKKCLETAEMIIATSPQEKEHMRRFMSDKGKIKVIPCGTDIKNFGSISRAKARLRLGIPKSSLMVLYVGRFDQRKGIETLVRALRKSIFPGIADIRLVLVGGWREGESDGREKARIEGIVNELGLEKYVTFAGAKNHEELPLYYAAANVCVVPSHYEPFGLVAIEAMASATPVIASKVGGLKYTVINEKTGLLCPAQDEAVFAEAIDHILNDRLWQAQLGQAARQRVEDHFSWKGVAYQLDNLYESLLKLPVKLSA